MRRLALALGALGFLAAGTGVANAGQAAATPTFTKDVAPMCYNNCVRCHRPGEIGPMQLIKFEEVRPWAKAIRDKVVHREMPPWSADSSRSVKFRKIR